MKKLILIPLLLILLLGGGAVAAVATGVVQPPELESVDNSWGEVTAERTEIRTAIALNNPNRIGIGLGSLGLDVDIAMNGIRIGTGTVDGIDLPQGPSTTNLTVVIDNTVIPDWWASHVGNGERTTAEISPTARASIFGRTVRVNVPTIREEIDTDILAGVNSDEPEDFPVGPFTMTMKSREFQWGEVTMRSTEIEGHLVLHHDAPVPVIMTRLDFAFEMNGVAVAEATTREPVVLPPRTDTPVPFSAIVVNQRLLDWWPTHIEADEVTNYRIDVDAVVEVDNALLGGQSVPLRLIRYQDRFETDILDRK